MRSILLLLVLSASALPSSRAQEKVNAIAREFVSPDGTLAAVVLAARPKDARSESRVSVRTRSGTKLVTRDYSSADGQHGYAVVHGAWTPDSEFFVYSLDNVGGHSPWHTPVEFFSREKNKVLSLDDLLKDAISDPRFKVIAPDKVKVELYFKKQVQTISLSSLSRQ